MQLTQKIIYLILSGFLLGGLSHYAKADSGDAPKETKEKSPIKTYMDLGIDYRNQSDNQQAIEEFQKGLILAEKTWDIKSILEFHNQIGLVYVDMSEYSKALEHFHKITDQYQDKSPGNNSLLASVYDSIAAIYSALGNHELAYEYQIKSLKQNELSQDTIGIAWDYYGIGTIFFYQENYDRALHYYDKSMEICKAMDDQEAVYACLAAIGSTCNRMGNTELSVQYNLNSLKLAKEINYDIGICYATQNIGSDYLELGQVTLAIDYFNQTLEILEKVQDKWCRCGTYCMLATAHTESSEYDLALEYAQKALDLAEEIKSRPRKMEIYKILASIYKASGQSDEAYDYLNKYLLAKDSSINKSTIQKMSDIKESYEIQKREKEIALIRKEQQLSYWQKNTFIGAFVLTLLMLWLIYSRYRTQYANNIVLAEKNNLIQKQNDQLEVANQRQVDMNQKLEDSNKELEQFAYVASHDLKEPLRTISSYTSLLQRRFLPKVSDPTANEFMNFIIDGTQRMQNLLDELLNYSRAIRSGSNIEPVNTNEVAEMVTFSLNHLIQEKNAKVNIGQLPVIKANKMQINQLFQNLISNAVKYTHEDNPMVSVQCYQEDHQFIFSIKDNGIGIAPEHKEEIFQMFRRLHTNKEFEGTGIGLATCKKIVAQYGGDIWVESEKNEGSTFYFSIPEN